MKEQSGFNPMQKGNSFSEEKDQSVPKRVENLKWKEFSLCLIFFIAVCFVVVLTSFTCYFCTPSRSYYGIDSWGNVCSGEQSDTFKVPFVNGSGKNPIDQQNLWLLNFHNYSKTSCAGNTLTSTKSLIKVCVKACPLMSYHATANSAENCFVTLQENLYDSNQYLVAQQLCSSFEHYETLNCSSNQTEEEKLDFSVYSNDTSKEILGRCIPSHLLDGGYVTIPNYLLQEHYVMHDMLACSYVIVQVAALIMASCISLILLVITKPELAFHICSFSSFFILFLSILYVMVKLIIVHQRQAVLKSNDDVILLTASLAVSACGIAWMIVLHLKYKSQNKKCRGFMIRSSKCIHLLPKILSQPLWTLFAAGAAIAHLIVYLVFVFSCTPLEASEDNSTAVYSSTVPFLSFPVFYLASILITLWMLNVIKTCQRVMISSIVREFYFSKSPQNLTHPLTKSLLLMLRYNLGNIIACSLNGRIQHNLIVFAANKLFRNTDSIARDEKARIPSSHTAYFSPMSPVAIGVYGIVRPTCICGDPYFAKKYFSGLKLPRLADILQENRKVTKSVSSTLAIGVSKSLRDCHAAARWCFNAESIALMCFSMPLYVFLYEQNNVTAYLKVFPFIATILVSNYVCDVWLSIMRSIVDTTAVCLYEDLQRNDGINNLFYGSRGLICRVTGAKLPLSSTHGGLQHEKKKRREYEKQKKKEVVRYMLEAKAQHRRRMSKRTKKKSISSPLRRSSLMQQIHTVKTVDLFKENRENSYLDSFLGSSMKLEDVDENEIAETRTQYIQKSSKLKLFTDIMKKNKISPSNSVEICLEDLSSSPLPISRNLDVWKSSGSSLLPSRTKIIQRRNSRFIGDKPSNSGRKCSIVQKKLEDDKFLTEEEEYENNLWNEVLW